MGLILLVLTSLLIDYLIINFLDDIKCSNNVYELYNIEEYKNEEDGFSSDDSWYELAQGDHQEAENNFGVKIITTTGITTIWIVTILYILNVYS